MPLHTLPKTTERGRRRGGQGYGSGRARTAGRGDKGQNARSKVPMMFEGGALPLTKRLPFLRGKGRNNSLQKKSVIINVSDLNKLPARSTVDMKTLVKYNIVKEDDAKQYGVKVLGNGDVTVSLTVAVPVSHNARVKIEKAKGSIIDAHE